MKKIVISLLLLCALLWSVWIVLPASSIAFLIEDSVNDARINVETAGVAKGLFYTFDIEKVVLRRSGKELLTLDSVHGRINPLSLFLLKVGCTFQSGLAGGGISGTVTLSRNSKTIRLDVTDAGIDKLQFLQRAGIRGTGTLSGRLVLLTGSGKIEFASENARFEPATVWGTAVPLNLFSRVTGALAVKDNTLNGISVSLEGRDVAARLKGRIQNALADLSMELMPGRTYAENPLFLAEFQRYRISPGYYIIPVRGVLSL